MHLIPPIVAVATRVGPRGYLLYLHNPGKAMRKVSEEGAGQYHSRVLHTDLHTAVKSIVLSTTYVY
jgi:hypothetical protein